MWWSFLDLVSESCSVQYVKTVSETNRLFTLRDATSVVHDATNRGMFILYQSRLTCCLEHVWLLLFIFLDLSSFFIFSDSTPVVLATNQLCLQQTKECLSLALSANMLFWPHFIVCLFVYYCFFISDSSCACKRQGDVYNLISVI